MTKLCVIGLGYIGLPTASMFANHGLQVVGVDINPHVIQVLQEGDIHIEEVGLKDFVRTAITSGNLRVQTTPEAADVFIIAVPTPIKPDKTADMRAVVSATEAILPHLRKGNLVVLESTSPPGTTQSLVRPILERGGLLAGKDFKLAYSPERVLPGQILKELVDNARVIGGVDAASAQVGSDLYATFVKGEIVLTTAVTAEMVKLMENTFRDVNIALANEFALLANQIDVDIWEAIQIANRHPRVKILRPGPGVGGHCIAVDPWFLVEAAPTCTPLIRQARIVNDGMPNYVLERAQRALQGIASPVVACLGLTYKADVDDIRESPAVEVLERLIHAGLTVRAYDPHITPTDAIKSHWANSIIEAVRDADLVILLVDHSEFKTLHPDNLTGMRRFYLLDTRQCVDSAVWASIAGYEVL
ncbi:UDP-N-acetyl-D-mannosamine dehydrogenase [Gammaproteobacteria bacterium]